MYFNISHSGEMTEMTKFNHMGTADCLCHKIVDEYAQERYLDFNGTLVLFISTQSSC